MRLRTVLVIVVLLSVSVVRAQTDTPTPTPSPTSVGGIPWSATWTPSPVAPNSSLLWPLPDLPILESPTPFPTEYIVETATATQDPESTEEPTVPPTPTSEPTSDIGEQLQDRVATLTTLLEATSIPIEVEGSEIDVDDAIDEMDSGAGTFLGYLRGVFSINFGVLQPLFVTLVVWFAVILGLKTSALMVPMIALIFGVMRKLIDLVLKLVPGLG